MKATYRGLMRENGLKIMKKENNIYKYKTISEMKHELDAATSVSGGELDVDTTQKVLKASYQKKNEDMNGYVVDKELSGQRVKVYHHPTENKTLVVHKGTASIQDWGTNLAMTFGIKTGKRFKHAKKIQKQAEAKYKDSEQITLGHSLGAKIAEDVGKKENEVITLNKPTLPLDVITGKKVKKNQTDVKTERDPVSILRGLQKGKKAKVVKSKTFNPLTEHGVDVLNRLNVSQIGV